MEKLIELEANKSRNKADQKMQKISEQLDKKINNNSEQITDEEAERKLDEIMRGSRKY